MLILSSNFLKIIKVTRFQHSTEVTGFPKAQYGVTYQLIYYSGPYKTKSNNPSIFLPHIQVKIRKIVFQKKL